MNICLSDRQLQRLLESRLTGDDEQAVLAHIDGCSACRELVAAAGRLGAADPPASPALADTDPGADPGGVALLPLVRGVVVGRYVVLDPIGTGAMGEVYAAYDPELDRKVALKLLREPGSDQALRLVREAQALARLSHPNVVPVHDAGVQGGRLFIAMELVQGRTLRAWLAERPRPWREVVEVFTSAGRGLSAAHEARILHRDFKPENVLVGDDGRVRVVDFGLAGPERQGARAPAAGSDAADGLTRSGMLLGTPAYMAPEVLEGQAATSASDQFSFAVSLYEGLHRHRPFAGRSIAEVLAAARAGAISPPRRGARPPAWLRRVVLRGLAPRPADRFPSMRAFLDALGRDPRRAWWRAASFVAGLGAAAAVLVLVGVRARREGPGPCEAGAAEVAVAWNPGRKVALQAAVLGARTASAPQAWNAVERALDGYARDWVEGYRDACVATEVRRDQSRELLDQRMDCLRRNLDELHALVDVLATPAPDLVTNAAPAVFALPPAARCAAASVLRAAVPPETPETEALRRDGAGVRALLRAGRFKEGLAAAVGLAARAAGSRDLRSEAAGLALLGEAESQARQLERAGDTFERAFHVAAAAGDERTAADALIGRSWVIGVLQGRHEDGAQQLRLARGYVQRLRDDALDGDVTYHEGIYRYEAGDGQGAEERFLRALALRQRVFGLQHPQVADLHIALGRARRQRGNLAEAFEDVRRAVSILEATLGPDHPKLDNYLTLLATSEWEDRGYYEEAIRLFERARDRARKRGEATPEEGYIDANLGGVLGDAGRYPEGIARAEEGLRILQAAVGDDHSKTGFARWVLARLYEAVGRHEDAIASADAALRGLAKIGDPPESVALTLAARAESRAASGRDGAREDAERGLALIQARFGPGRSERALAALSLGEVLLAAGRPGAALGHGLTALLDATLALGARHPLVARAERLAGVACLELGEASRGRALLAKAVELYSSRRGDLVGAARARFALARALGPTPEARALAGAARDALKQLASHDPRDLQAVERWLAEAK